MQASIGRGGRWLVPRNAWRRPPAWLAAAATLLLAGMATAQNAQVYLTYSPEDRGPLSSWAASIAGEEAVPLFLWLQGGGTVSSGAPCQLGATGSEICGANVTLDGQGFFQFEGFTPNPTFDRGPLATPIVVSSDGQRIKLNALDFAPGNNLENRLLGQLTVLPINQPGPEDAAVVSGGVLGSNLSMRDLEGRDVIVPEPAFAGGIAVALLALAGAVRRSRAHEATRGVRGSSGPASAARIGQTDGTEDHACPLSLDVPRTRRRRRSESV